MRSIRNVLIAILLLHSPAAGQQITSAGKPAELAIRVAGSASIRVTLKPLSYQKALPFSPAVAERTYPVPALSLRTLTIPVRRKIGSLSVVVTANPLTVAVSNAMGEAIQTLTFQDDGKVSFVVGDHPVLGMGEGGPLPGRGNPFRTLPIQYDRRGRLDTMEPRWQSDAYGSRNPVATLLGTEGWGLFVATPWVQVDLAKAGTGTFIPWWPAPTTQNLVQNERNQQQALGKGLPPLEQIVPGLYDVFVFDAHNPLAMMKDYSVITGPAVLPPKWALGYMQSHRTLQTEKEMLGVIDTFRSKKIPVDAVIYLGTGFAPVGWNKKQPSFEFNPEVFLRDPKVVIADMHARNVKLVVHMVPWDRDKLPALQGSIPAKAGETLDASHIQNYWQQHVALKTAGVDAFWPDEGDWFNLWERVKRHQLYYQGELSTTPNVRPWSLHRNGYPGIAQWGGWVWSGDTESSWKTLEGQIAVGINYSLSIGPYWGSDIGGFYPTSELTGEMYARWFQFASFCGSFRSHGRDWWMRLPWGWGLSELGPRENVNGANAHPLPSELNNPAIEPVARKYDELRYQLMPYTYTLAYEARSTGLPLMRAMWLHYPTDETARGLGNQFLWGRDLLVAPVYEKGATSRNVYLPKGDWYDWWNNEKSSGGRTISRAVDLSVMPIYVRAGAIIPFDPIRQYTAQPVTEPTTLRIYRGANGSYTLYEDDGISQQYLKGRGSWTKMAWNDQTKTLTLQPGAPAGSANVVAAKSFKVELLPEGVTKELRYAGKLVSVKF